MPYLAPVGSARCGDGVFDSCAILACADERGFVAMDYHAATAARIEEAHRSKIEDALVKAEAVSYWEGQRASATVAETHVGVRSRVQTSTILELPVATGPVLYQYASSIIR